MAARHYVPTYSKHPECAYRMKRGWFCSRRRWHTGPCALRPKWWNLWGHIEMRL